jgi:UDP-N-acetylmuramoylalanine--D-glutamate ligase
LKNSDLRGKSIIIGLGKTGLSVAKYFAVKGLPFEFMDTRLKPPMLEEFKTLFPNIKIQVGKLKESSLLGAKELIVSPGLSIKTPEIQRAKDFGIPVRGDIDIFSKAVKAPIIGVTGSNGKSTVVALLSSILKRAGKSVGLGGNLDGSDTKSALDLLGGEDKDIYLLELSSFQLETTESLGAEVAVILNLSEDHMDRYDTLKEYHEAKLRVFNGCRQLVINRDDVNSYPKTSINVPVWDFGVEHSNSKSLSISEIQGEQYITYKFEKIIAVSDLQLFGKHNISNALAAIALALSLGIDINDIKSAVINFPGLPHRCQWIRDLSGVSFYNDSKGTNVGATMAAIEGLGHRIKGDVILIAGGLAKGADFSPLVPAINKWAKELVLIGEDAEEMASNFCKNIPTNFARDMRDAVGIANEKASPGDVVLLSPACASFDMYRNFQHRGQVFIESVENLS